MLFSRFVHVPAANLYKLSIISYTKKYSLSICDIHILLEGGDCKKMFDLESAPKSHMAFNQRRLYKAPGVTTQSSLW